MFRRVAIPLCCALFLAGCYTADELRGIQELSVEGEYVIGMSDAATEASVEEFAAAHGLEVTMARQFDRLAVLVDSEDRDRKEVLDLLADSTLTEYAEPHFIYEAMRTPDDYGDYLWGLHNTGASGGVVGADMNAFDAWDISTGSGVIIAVIDTGLDVTHPDIAPNLWTNPGEVPNNGVDDDNNGYIDDVHGYDFVHDDGNPDDREGHGTHVAGTAAAKGDDGYGVVGAAFDAKIMGLKFLDRGAGGYSSMAAAAIHYAVNHGADVINASWGGYGQSTAIRNAIAYARSQGVIVVAAAGNEGNDNDGSGLYPASYTLDNIISVAASDRRDRIASFSNFGRNTVDLAAPGVSIVSTVPGADWGYMDGTSMASPMVTGVVALMRSAAPNASIAEIRDALLGSTAPLAAGSDDVATGGRVDAHAALIALLGADTPDDPPAGDDDDDDDAAPPSPEEWSYVELVIESAHPYSNDFSGSAAIEPPAGASEVRLHFERIDTEANYDFVQIKNDEGTKLQEWTGSAGAVNSDTFPVGEGVRMHLYTDYSVTGWGLKLSGYSWR